jgi:hypothetical protein
MSTREEISYRRVVHQARLENNALKEKHRRLKFICQFKEDEEKHAKEFHQLQIQINNILYGKK